jgi:MFS family permease
MACRKRDCALADSYHALFVGRVLVGVGEATLGPAAYSLIADIFPAERRAAAFSIYSMGITVGTGLATVIAGSAATLASTTTAAVLPAHPWQYVFFVVGAPGLAVAVLALTIREPARTHITQTQRTTFAETLAFMRSRRQAFVCCMIGFGMFSIFNQGVGFWMPEFFVRTFGWQKSAIGQTQGWTTAVCGTAGLFAGGHFTARREQRGEASAKLQTLMVSCVGLLLSAETLFAASFVDATGRTSALLLAPVAFFGFAPYGAAIALVQDLTPASLRGQMGAMFLLVINAIGGGAGPILVSTLTDYVFGTPVALRFSMMLMSGFALGTASLLYWWGIKKRVTL